MISVERLQWITKYPDIASTLGMLPAFRYCRVLEISFRTLARPKILTQISFSYFVRGSRLTYLIIHFVLKRNRENFVWAFSFKKKKGGTKDRIFVPYETKYCFSYAIRGVASYLLNTIFRFVFRMGGSILT